MRLLYVARLFTGLERSVMRGRWEPTGVPTIYKMLEALDRQCDDMRIMLTAKDRGRGSFSSWEASRDVTLPIEGLRHEFTVLAGDERHWRGWPRQIRNGLREVRHAWRVFREFLRYRPDVVYLDNSNFLIAAILARLPFRTPVVFRVMGVYPAMRKALDGGTIGFRLLRWAYRSPFDLVVCSQDGSGVEPWLARALDPAVRREVLINGVERGAPTEPEDPRVVSLPEDRVKILYVGKMETYKGSDDFVEAVLRLRDTHGDRIHAVMVGVGNRRDPLIGLVAERGAAELFSFIDRLPHPEIMALHRRCQIYVSLNSLGNLSNANLEAMVIGDCLIMPEADPDTGIDVTTDRLIGADAVVRVPRGERLVAELAARIGELVDAPERRRTLGRTLAARAESLIPTWDRRIGGEIRMIEALVGKRGIVGASGGR